MAIYSVPGEAIDYEAITVSTSAVGLTAAKVTPSNAPPPLRAFITVETAACRIRLDGTDPTASEGHLLNVGDAIIVSGRNNLRNFRAIRAGASDSALKVTYLR